VVNKEEHLPLPFKVQQQQRQQPPRLSQPNNNNCRSSDCVRSLPYLLAEIAAEMEILVEKAVKKMTAPHLQLQQQQMQQQQQQLQQQQQKMSQRSTN